MHFVNRCTKLDSRSAISSCYIYFWQKPGYRFICRYRDDSGVLISLIPCSIYTENASLFTLRIENRDVPLIPDAARHRRITVAIAIVVFVWAKKEENLVPINIEKRGVIVYCVGHNKINIRIFGVSRQDIIFNTKQMYFFPLFYSVIS